MIIEQEVIGGEDLMEKEGIVGVTLPSALEKRVVRSDFELSELPELVFVVKVKRVVGRVVGLAIFVAGRLGIDFIVDAVRKAWFEETLESRLGINDSGIGTVLALQARIRDVVVVSSSVRNTNLVSTTSETSGSIRPLSSMKVSIRFIPAFIVKLTKQCEYS